MAWRALCAFFTSCFDFALRFWNQFCTHVSFDALVQDLPQVAHIDFIQRNIQRFGKSLLGTGVWFCLVRIMCLEDVMLLFCKPRLDVTSDLMLCHRRGIWIPGLLGHGCLRHGFVVLLVMLLLELLCRHVAEIGRIHGLVRRISAAVVHLVGRVLGLRSRSPALVETGYSESGRAGVARAAGRGIETGIAVERGCNGRQCGRGPVVTGERAVPGFGQTRIGKRGKGREYRLRRRPGSGDGSWRMDRGATVTRRTTAARLTGGRKGAARAIQQVKSGALRRGYATRAALSRPQPARSLPADLGESQMASACALCDAELCGGRARGYGAESAPLLASMPAAVC